MRKNIYGGLILVAATAVFYLMGSKFFHVTNLNPFLLIMVALALAIVLSMWFLFEPRQIVDGGPAVKPPTSAVECLVTRRKPAVPWALVVAVALFAVFIPFFHLYTGWFGKIEDYFQRVAALYMTLILAILLQPLGRKKWWNKLNAYFIVDALMIAGILACGYYLFSDYHNFLFRVAAPKPTDIIVGTFTILVIMEMTRRYTGLPLVLLAIIFLSVNLFGDYLPGVLKSWSVPWPRIVEVIFMQNFAIFGEVASVLTDFLYLFFLLSAFLGSSGMGDVLKDVALALVGRFTGGPAKVSVIASAVFGTISGSILANIATTGSFTIPMMKRSGYRPEFAGAVETASSSAGQIMPPVMGATAFLIAQFLGISYWQVCLVALLPVALYVLGLFLQIHWEAVKYKLKGLPKEECPPLWPSLAQGYNFFLPLALLIFFIAVGYSLSSAAIYALGAFFVLSMARRRTRLTSVKFVQVLEEGGRSVVSVAVTCFCAGIIIGGFYISGFGELMGGVIVQLATGKLFLAGLITAVVCIVLGMGVPTIVAYIIVFLFAIPTLVSSGVPPIAAHFFAFYYAVTAAATPPVALGAYLGAGMAGAKMMPTALIACRLMFTMFILPFMFLYQPGILLQAPPGEIVLAFVRGAVGVLAGAAGLEGYLLRVANWPERIVLMATGLSLFLVTNLWLNTLALVLIVLVIASQKLLPYQALSLFRR